jgi:hypothetical protein
MYKNSLLRIILFCTALFCTIFIVHAQKVQVIRGVIIDEDTGYPISGATVSVKDIPGKVAVTDSNGVFVFIQAPLGNQYISVHHILYEPVKQYEVIVLSGKEPALTIALKEAVTVLDDVVVVPNEQKQGGVTILPAIVNRYAGNVRDPLRMLTATVGVQNLSDDKNDLIVRGNSPIGVLWKLEGCEILNPNHFSASGGTGGTISLFNPDILGVSTLYTGAFPARFGNVLSAVFDTGLRTGSAYRFEHYAQLSSVDFNIGSEGYIKKEGASYNIAYRQSFVAAMETVSGKYSEQLGATPDFNDLSAKLFFPYEKGATSIWAVGGLSRIEVKAGNGVNNTQLNIGNKTKTLSAGVTQTLFLTNQVRLKINLYTSLLKTENKKQHSDYNMEGGFPSSLFDDSEQRYGINATLNAKLNAKNILNAGIATTVLSSAIVNDERQYPEDMLFYYEIEKRYSTFNSFAEWKHRFNSKIESVAGLHYFHFFLNNQQSIEPRIAINWQPGRQHAMAFSAGMYSRQNPIGLYLQGERQPSGDVTQPNLSLGFMKSLQTVLTYQVAPFPKWHVDVNVFYQYHYNIAVSQIPSSFSALNLAYYFDDIYLKYQKIENNGVGQNYGMEISTRFDQWRGYYVQFNGTLFSATARGSNNTWYHTAFNNSYALTLLAGKELKIPAKNFSFTFDISAHLAGGRRYTPLDVSQSIAQRRIIYDENQLYAKQYTPYSRLDFKIGFLYNAKTTTHVLSLDLRNILDKKNIYEQIELPLNGEVFTYTLHQLQFFPVISYKIMFSSAPARRQL